MNYEENLDLVHESIDGTSTTDFNKYYEKVPDPIGWHKNPHFVGTVKKSPLIKVDSKLRLSLILSFSHLNPTENYNVRLYEGDETLWEVQYMQNGELHGLIGRVSSIIKYEQTDFNYNKKESYKITFDTSHAFFGKKVTVDSDNIRLIVASKYNPPHYPVPPEKPDAPIIVPPSAFNFIKRIYPKTYKSLRTIPNPLIMDHVKDALSMFAECISVIDLAPMNTVNLINMDGMFARCYSLKFIPKMITDKVVYMVGAFADCEDVEYVHYMNTENVVKMDEAFKNCKKIKILPEMNMKSVVSAENIFQRCTSLEEVKFVPNTLRIGLDFSQCNLTPECVLQIIKDLGTPLTSTKSVMVFATTDKYKFPAHIWDAVIQPMLHKGWGFRGIQKLVD